MVMRWPIIVLALAVLTLCSCPSPKTATRQTAPGAQADSGAAAVQAGTEGTAGAELQPPAIPGGPPPVEEAPQQLILIYSGDTLSRTEMSLDFSPPEGGLCALAATIVGYEAQIVELNRLRVLNAGGDPTGLDVDYEQGLLGEHPYMLLDYGGWSRPNDFAGGPYVELYFRMFEALSYTAVGCKLYHRLQRERWQAYRQLAPEGFSLLSSAGEPRPEALAAIPVVTREVRGKRWGVVSVPLPVDPGPEQFETLKEYTGHNRAQLTACLDEASAALAEAGCDYSILLFSEGPPSLYDELAEDPRFTVVIGAPARRGVGEERGTMPGGGALLLPELNGSGREIGVCHIYFTPEGDVPQQYYFSRKPCIDDPQQPYPFRPQVAEAVAEHDQLVADWMGG